MFAHNYARYSGTPEDSARVLRDIEEVKKLPPAEFDKLLQAKPQGAIDIPVNVTKYLAETMSDEQKAAFAYNLALRNKTFDRAQRMTAEDVREAVGDLIEHHTPEEFIDLSKLKGLNNPADFTFMRSIIATYAQEVDTGRAELQAASILAENAKARKDEGAIAAIEKAKSDAEQKIAHGVIRRDAAVYALIPETTKAGRVLQALKTIAQPLGPEETFKARFFGAMRASGIKQGKADEFYKLLNDTLAQGPAADWRAFTTAFRRAIQPKFFDKFLEFWKAGLLGIPTQIVNIASNTAYLGLRNVEHGVAVLANNFLSGLTGAPKKRFIGEIGARLHGGRTAFAEAIGSLSRDVRDISSLRPPDIQRRLTEGTFRDEPNLRQLYGAIGGRTGEFIRIPFKLLDAFDNFNKHIIRNQEWAASANRLARDPSLRTLGESVTHATSRIYVELRMVARDPLTHQSIYKKPGYKEAIDAGRKAATDDTFQQALTGTALRDAAHSYQRATNQLPALQLLTPFTKTPYNILSEAMKRTPAAALLAIKKFASGEITNEAFVEDMVKSALGTTLMAVAAEAALDGSMTGGGPANPKEAEILKRTGWQPYSMKIGNQYISYQRTAPFSSVLGIAADMAEAWKNKDITTGAELLQKGVASVSDNITNQSFLQGIESAMKIWSDPGRSGLSAMRQLQASLIPNIVGVVPVGHLATAIDPVYRETEAFTRSPFLSRIPGLSQTLPAQMTPTGEERPRKGTVLERLVSPFARSEVQTGPIAESAAEISRLGIGLTAPPLFFRVGQERVYYSEDQRRSIADAQEKSMTKIASLIRSSDYRRLPDDENVATAGQRTKRDEIMRIVNHYRGPVSERARKEAMRRAKYEDRG